ncbi:ATP-binding protein [Candidatus Saccharibacteria bacterium]|nr:ATP-binding protein [Candidatus Saccharibacteria bacterium]
MIPRTLERLVKGSLDKGRVIIIYGPRRIGKTTLVRKIMADAPKADQLYLNCDELSTKRALTPTSLASLEQVIGQARTIVIDEAQRVENIGLTLKILVDAHPKLNIIATGSSSFDLANKVKEPLTGRSIEFLLTPLSIHEIKKHYGYQSYQLGEIYEKMMRFGAYPHIFEMDGRQAERELLTITSQYVFKDTLELVELRQQQLLPRLLQALALQMGSEVSYHELGVLLGVKNETVARYITLLEQSFIVYRLPALTGNQRSQLSNRKRKVYFYDLGIRNALIENFNELILRQDRGALWETLCVNERRKLHSQKQRTVSMYYWRGLYGKVDLVENFSGNWRAFKCNWSEEKFSVPKYFRQNFPDIQVKLLSNKTLSSYLD